MRSSIYIFGITLLTCSFSFAGLELDNTLPNTISPHQFNIGPDVFVSHSIQKFSLEKNERVKVKSNTILGGLRLDYDYLNPQHFYFGTSGSILTGKNFGNIHIRQRYENEFNKEVFKLKSSSFLANAEQRFGYTFETSEKLLFSPFCGVGSSYFRSLKSQSLFIAGNWFYGATGVRILQKNFTNIKNLDLGFNVKIIGSFVEKAPSKVGTASSKSLDVWGCEVALPITWYSEKSKQWHLQFEPYLATANVNIDGQSGGSRFQAGYGF